MVQLLELKGHKASVLSLAHSSESIGRVFSDKKSFRKSKVVKTAICHLLSGDEAGTTRIWDLRYNSHRASHCILAPSEAEVKDVTAVGFHPLFDTDFPNEVKEGSSPFTIYTAVGSKVYGYDLRYAKNPSIISQYDFYLSSFDGEEINGIDFYHQVKQKTTMFASADDDGKLRVTNYAESKKSGDKPPAHLIFREYDHSDEASPSLVTSLAFRPKSIKSIDIATGGTDCTISLWDVNKPHNKPSSTLIVSQDSDESAQKSGVNQICNPPIVHSLSWSPSGKILSAGLGDGTCMIACMNGRRLEEMCRLRNGHDSAVASVLFPAFDNDVTNYSSEDRLMISAGTDGSILLWDLGSKVAGKDAINPERKVGGCNRNDVDDVQAAMENVALTCANDSEPKILFGIPHEKKINYMANSSSDEVALPHSLFVADTTNNISVYTLPMNC